MVDLSLGPEDAERIRIAALAKIEERKRAGTWTGGVQPHTEYQKRPVEWAVDKLGIPLETLRWSVSPEYEQHAWDGHKDPIALMMETLAESQDCAVESATGVGKTFGAAIVVLWFLACFEDSIVITAAPKSEQLLKQVWKEIGSLFTRFQKHFPDAQLLTGLIRMKPAEHDKEKWAAQAFVCGVGADEEAATKAQGFHAPDMLIITEETPGIHSAIMNSFFNTRTDDHNLHLALGNPDHQQDELHKFAKSPGVKAVRISAFDHPNVVCNRTVIPGAIGKIRLELRIAKLGKDSRLYQSRVRGISPAEAADALIKWEWCTAAAARWADPKFREGLPALGVDVANSPNGDKGAIARWQGACCTEVVSRPCPDANLLGAEVALEAESTGVDDKHIGVDPVGVGAGCVNELRRRGRKVRKIGGGTKAIPGLDQDILWSELSEPDEEGQRRARGPAVVEAERFVDMRSQVWWRAREDLRLGRIAIPVDEELFQDLTTPTFGTENGKIWVESKEKLVERLGRSPDKGDAFCYGNWVRRRAPVFAPRQDTEESRDRDTRLEKMLARMEQKQKEEHRAVMRVLRQRGRLRKKRGP